MATDDPGSRLEVWMRRHPWAGDVVLAVAVAAVTLPSSLDVLRRGDLGPGWTTSAVGAVVVAHLAIGLRRRAPVAVFAVCALVELLLAVSPVLSDPQTPASYPAVLVPSSATYLVAAYTLSARGRGAWPLVSLLVGVLGSLIVAVRSWVAWSTSDSPLGGVPDLLFLGGLALASVVAAWALGRFRRLRADQMRTLAERARRAEDDRDRRQRQAAADERARIARELHDVIAHSVSVMVRQAEGGRYVAAKDPVAATTALAAIADTGREALTDIRSMLGVLDAEPGPAAFGPPPTTDHLPELVERVRAAGQPVRYRVDGEPQPLDRAAQLAAYRLVQEALTNVVKHAGPEVAVEVVLTWSRRSLRLEVTDPGTPSRVAPAGNPDGRGLAGMRERLQLVGGSLRVGPTPSGGFAVVGEIPTAVTTAADRDAP